MQQQTEDSPIDIQPSNFISKLLDPTIFELIVPLTLRYKAINLASGFPDWETPEFLFNHTNDAFHQPENQYAPPSGHPLLIQKVVERYSKLLNREILPQNVAIGLGGSGVIYDIYTSFLNSGDELIVFEPFFEYHSKEAKLLGAQVRVSPFIEPEDFENGQWKINFEQFESLFNEKTRMLVLNSPHNPTGKVFTKEEYQKIAEIVKKYPKVLVLADDVYETLLFDNREFPRFADIPGMFDRTLSVFSLGKMFSCTGWRVGFSIGPQNFIKVIRATHSIICYSVNRPAQVGFARALEEIHKKYLGGEDDYLVTMRKRFEKNRNALIQGFKDLDADLKLNKPEGGYFIVGSLKDHTRRIPRRYFYKDYENVPNGDKLLGDTPFEKFAEAEVTPDVAFFKYMIVEKGVTVIPMSSFYLQDDPTDLKNIKGRYNFRIALCRKDQTIISAFQKLKQTLSNH